jgi:hypothetical protein
MKNLVRVLALALVATGAVVSSTSHKVSANAVFSPRSSALPIPMCPPGDPTGCGVCKYNGSCVN